MSEIASPLKIGSSRMKEAPIIAASAVSAMGLARAAAACMTASCGATPAASRWFTKSTSRIEFLTMIPASAIMPIMEVAVNCAPNSA